MSDLKSFQAKVVGFKKSCLKALNPTIVAAPSKLTETRWSRRNKRFYYKGIVISLVCLKNIDTGVCCQYSFRCTLLSDIELGHSFWFKSRIYEVKSYIDAVKSHYLFETPTSQLADRVGCKINIELIHNICREITLVADNYKAAKLESGGSDEK